MVIFGFEALLLFRAGDQLVVRGAGPVANYLSGCANGHVPSVSVGYEDRLMGLGLNEHLAASVEDRTQVLETGNGRILVRALRELHVCGPHRAIGELAALRRALAQVGPGAAVGLVPRSARLGHHVDHAGARDGTETRNVV